MSSKRTPVIGIEVHVELATKSKMFCGCPADHFNKPANSQTCPVCLGLPGALPVPNKKAVEWTLMLGLALGSKIAKFSKFDRKHYFYPDLAKGYQISQYDQPFCLGGHVDTTYGKVQITRAHLEEDTGKLIHQTISGKRVSLVDFNRGGVPLVEIVSEPDITSSTQAKEYAKNLATIIRFLGISDADMDKGSMRLEANVSWGMDLGYKVEVKNINSFNYLAKAIDYELKRQAVILDKGEKPTQETRGYDEDKGVTFSQRTKEEAADYRYFPEPDIPPIVLNDDLIATIKKRMPKMPIDYRKFWAPHQLSQLYLEVLLASPQLAKFTDTVFGLAVKAKLNPIKVAGEIVNKKITPQDLTPAKLIDSMTKASLKVTDKSEITKWITQAIEANPEEFLKYQQGKESLIDFFVGQVMQLSRGQADAAIVVTMLKTELKK